MSARATASSPAAPRGKQGSTKPRVRITARAAVLLFVVFVVGMFAIAPMRAYFDQRSRLQQLEQVAAELERQNGDLESRIADLQDPATLERLARACLGMVEPGEIAIVTVPKKGAPTPPDCG